MEINESHGGIISIAAHAADYCSIVERAGEENKEEFVVRMTELLPLIYIDFARRENEMIEEADYGYYNSVVDEEWYESVRRSMAALLGSDDTYLETFEEDMKYSDTPIAASISEGLADIFQALYNFISIIKESEGSEAQGAYAECRENFATYWSQTLCNTLRALNNIRYR